MPDIMHLVRIDAPPARVYDALTTAAGIREWWTSDAELDDRVGGRGMFRFHGSNRQTDIRIDALEPVRHVGWTTTASFRPEWIGTKLTFDLRAELQKTVLTFAQRGFAEACEGYAVTTTGWGLYLVSLQLYMETGTGTPR
jgi:uncharacterized protein YndB with AHSA1/START domain